MVSRVFPLIFILFVAFSSSIAADDEWLPVSQEELDSTVPQVEKGANAETLFWEVRVADELVARAGFQSILNHYIRIKIFTEKGRESLNRVDIPFGRDSADGTRVYISKIAARSVAPDGTVSELDSKEIYEREILKSNDVKVNAKSFLIPDVKKGSVIEYRWKEIRRDTLSYFVRLQLTREIPVRRVKYYLKPVSNSRFGMAMRIQTINVGGQRSVPEKGGFYSMTFRNLKAFRNEPYMPPEYRVRPWLLVYYAWEEDDTGVTPRQYWANQAARTYEFHKAIKKPSKEVRAAAKEAASGATSVGETIKRIFVFCRKNIKNIFDDASGITSDQLEKIKRNKSPKHTLRNKRGTPHDINMLFASMLNAVGVDARFANVTLRSNPRFSKSLLNSFHIGAEVVAVRTGIGWEFYEPGAEHLRFGMLSWRKEGQTALISGEGTDTWADIPDGKPEDSTVERNIDLTLSEDGTAEADVTIRFTGHPARQSKENLDNVSDSAREKAVEAYVKELIGDSAELREATFQGIEDPEAPLEYRFKLTVPSLAEVSGKRLFLRPHVFGKNKKSLFQTSGREHNVFFRYRWTELDTVSIKLPDGYEPEVAEASKPVKDSDELGSHETTISFDPTERKLKYSRKFMFGNTKLLEFGSWKYRQLKTLFDAYHKADSHVITLRRAESVE